jgi:Ca2+-binding EF-hand superfamily protein
MEKARESIKAVFCKFDKDNSGFIDRNELKMAIAETGVTMNNMDVYNMM